MRQFVKGNGGRRDRPTPRGGGPDGVVGMYPIRGYAGRRRGFTLIEVLVALAIVGFAATALVASYVNVLNAYAVVGKAAEKDEDLRFARSQLLVEADRTKAEQGNSFDLPEGGRATWKTTIESTDVPDLFHVTFTCEFSGTDRVSTGPVTENFMLLRPTWSDGAEASKLRQNLKDRITELQQKRIP